MEEKCRLAAKKWALTGLKTICQKPDKAVYSAQSPDFGPVILKIDKDTDQLEAEYRMLSRLEECRVYDFDEKNGLLLEEQILPGTPLRQEPDAEKRLRVFADIFRRIHREDSIGPSYLDWLDGIVKYCQMYLSGTELERKVKKAFDICVEMYTIYPKSLLLHGDLHHDNILLRGDGTYVVIDPKGVTGPAILDVPRFILNEIGMGTLPEESHIRWVIEKLSTFLCYPADEIGKVFYMETVLANLWHMEDGEPVRQEELKLAEKFLT